MIEYSLSFSSFKAHSTETIYRILRLPVMSKILFPAYYYTDIGDTLIFENADQIKLEDLSNEIEDELSFILILEGPDGLIFKISIHKLSGRELVFPHMLSVRFSDLHFQVNDEFNLDILKTLFEDFVPIFNPHAGGLHQKNISNTLRKNNIQHIFSTMIHGKPYQFELCWISYCGSELLDFAGQERFGTLESCLESYHLGDGMMLILQEEPYVDSNPKHRQRFEALVNELRFKELRH